jgi:hypothetical protein
VSAVNLSVLLWAMMLAVAVVVQMRPRRTDAPSVLK